MMPSCDQTGVPGLFGFTHFHSSTTSGSACLMRFRILLRVSPRQSPSSAILCEISCDADWPWLALDFFMFSSSRGLNAELLCVLRVQSLPAAELHGLGAGDASNRRRRAPTGAAAPGR